FSRIVKPVSRIERWGQGASVERDPVCGMSVDPQRAAAKVAYAAKTYYFCAPGCARRFEKEPEKYLQAPAAAPANASASAPSSQATLVTIGAPPHSSLAAGAPLSSAEAAGVRYTCPMHPQVVQIGPGSCP